MFHPVEALATLCNISSNGVVLHTMCNDPHSPIPRGALALQVCANVSWLIYAAWERDAYLGATALASLTLQTSSLFLRMTRKRTPIRVERSADELQKFPLTNDKH